MKQYTLSTHNTPTNITEITPCYVQDFLSINLAIPVDCKNGQTSQTITLNS